MLNKKTVVLDYIEEASDVDGAYYGQLDVDGETVAVALSIETAAEMGDPEQITVTVQAGDRLTKPEVECCGLPVSCTRPCGFRL